MYYLDNIEALMAVNGNSFDVPAFSDNKFNGCQSVTVDLIVRRNKVSMDEFKSFAPMFNSSSLETRLLMVN